MLRRRIDGVGNAERLIKQNPHKQSLLAQDVTGRVLRELAGTAANGLAQSKSITPSLLGKRNCHHYNLRALLFSQGEPGSPGPPGVRGRDGEDVSHFRAH